MHLSACQNELLRKSAEVRSKNLNVYDVVGRAVYSGPINDMFTTLDLQKLRKGVYVVKISAFDGKVLYTEKIVKE